MESTFWEYCNEILAGGEMFYLFLAIAGSTIFVIQFIMTVAGLDHMDADTSSEVGEIAAVNFFSLKSIVSFVTFFGWGGYFWGDRGWSGLLIAFICGFIMMFLTTMVIYLLLKMQHSGNISDSDYLNAHGTVYLSIPSGRAPGGRVTVKLPGCTREITAVADEEIASGTAVVVRELLPNGEFLVSQN